MFAYSKAKKMSDFFEVDFLPVGKTTSGDAITIRYKVNGVTNIHVVDGGYQDNGDEVVAHVKKYYGENSVIDHVVATHPDGDHAGGLRKVLAEFEVKNLWMNRPWLYAASLIDRFSHFTNVANLEKRFREIYPNIYELEKIANERNIPISEAFQGAKIGEFTVMAPTKSRWLDLIVESEKSPQILKAQARVSESSLLDSIAAAATKLWKAAWGQEDFSNDSTSAENEMSIVQFARILDNKILLTADTGKGGLRELIDYAPNVGLILPGIDRFQVPHHGSRRNVDTELLDEILGERKDEPLSENQFSAIVSAAKESKHPRKVVVRAMHHRGGNIVSTEGKALCSHGGSAPDRGWSPSTPLPYPEEMEE